MTTTIHVTTILMPTSEMHGTAVSDREETFRTTLNKALTQSGLDVRELFGVEMGRTFINETQSNGAIVGNPYVTVTLGADLGDDDTEIIEDACNELDLPGFATSAWRFPEA